MKTPFDLTRLNYPFPKVVAPIVVALLVSSCAPESQDPSAPAVKTSQASLEINPRAWRAHDDVLDAIADRVPAFAGLYVDSTGIVVLLTDPATPHATVEAAIRPVLAAAEVSGHFELSRASHAPVRFERGEFAFAQLRSWKRGLYRHEVPKGTVFVGIDNRSNRLAVSVTSFQVREEWDRMATAEGVSSRAIEFNYMSPPFPMTANLRDSVASPTAGGLQITHSGGTCTLGANVGLSSQPGANYFITASHCSNNMWAVDASNDIWYQPAYPRRVGAGEDTDPAPFTGSPCPSGRVCRWSDATLVRYDGDSIGSVGRVTRANSVPSGSPAPTISYFEQYAWPSCFWCGLVTNTKTGRTTGTTTFSANYSSQDYYPDSAAYAGVGVLIRSNWVILSQNVFTSGAALGGDSGAPVYAYENGPPYYPLLTGIYHAGNAAGTSRVVSPLAGVANDLAGGYFNLIFY
ncbi:MAG: hypothetical protein H7039_17375 [Bryobacteraceae bacterium]|nr:hypothetical protein [Bryobacteraceae bacterium]